MVRGLATFVEKNFRGWKSVRPRGPLIIDGYSLCHELYLHSGADNVHSGDYVSFSKYIVRFLTCLLQNQIKPYVVFDGIDAEQSKKETHDKRRIENAQRVNNLLKGIPSTSRADYYLPYLARLVMMEAVLRVVGEENLYVADGDADAIIASLAVSRRCPVLSIDSDFYIFPIPEGYIPFTDMKWNERGVEAKIFYYRDFARQYGIEDPQLLIMLPAILGDSMLQPLNDALEMLTKTTRIRAEAVLKYASQFSIFEDCKDDITRISRRNPLDNVETAYKTYYSSIENFPSEGTTALKVKDSWQSIPKFILDLFRKGKFPTLLMDVMCCGEVDHRITVEDMSGPWCHEVGLTIRETIYGIVCGNRGSIAEHQRRKGKVNEFPLIRVRAKMPPQFGHYHDAPILDAQYRSDASKFGKDIMMTVSLCPGEFRGLGIPNEFWFFYAVSCFWYSHVGPQVNKDLLLKAIILSAIKNLKAQDIVFPVVQAMPNPPDASLVHALAQWQSIYYDLYCLNQLLLEPLPSLQISLVFECSNVVKFFSMLCMRSGGDLIQQMGLSDVDKNIYRSLYNAVKKT